jgi:hypothetical protein
MIKYLLAESDRYTRAVSSRESSEGVFAANMSTSMMLAGIAGALLEARKAAPPETRFFTNEEENG